MKLLSAQQTRDLDQYTIEHEPISSIELMERAANAFVARFIDLVGVDTPVFVFCGLGNNGADGLAISRLLLDKEYDVITYVIKYTDKTSSEFTDNEKRLNAIKPLIYLDEESTKPTIPNDVVIIDSLFGSGLYGPVEGLGASYINFLNNINMPIISVDMPSGLYCDLQNETNTIVKATYTLTFHLPKLSFMLPQNHEYVGTWEILDIDLDENFIEATDTPNFFTTADSFAGILKGRTKYAHKGTYGHALIVAGSYGMIGAAVLASKACVRAGAGLTSVHLPKCGIDAIHAANPEVVVSPDEDKKYFTDIENIEKYTAIGIGPGLGQQKDTVKALQKLLKQAAGAVVLDADAINIIGDNKELLKTVPKNSIFTPHPKEFERLAGRAENEYERLKLLRNFAKKYEVVCLLKGAHTAIALPNGDIHFNSTGNPGMAKGGSGDVLTGIITSLLAQNYTSEEAAILGVYLHGLAGDIAAETINLRAITASDIIHAISEAYDRLDYSV